MVYDAPFILKQVVHHSVISGELHYVHLLITHMISVHTHLEDLPGKRWWNWYKQQYDVNYWDNQYIQKAELKGTNHNQAHD